MFDSFQIPADSSSALRSLLDKKYHLHDVTMNYLNVACKEMLPTINIDSPGKFSIKERQAIIECLNKATSYVCLVEPEFRRINFTVIVNKDIRIGLPVLKRVDHIIKFLGGPASE